ncbi:hypothetical protein CJF42_00305 [Pseudoalteromonas sp. NBT06-2]|uniref:hypothetical protein n=1 Tax=Pseudoalteromonas sp. NBT06-2 TaxID=2025950 RepID=UPI000BA654ED|nr:hypothetical protein [Pseudoalteromonas sp. NBT06-2]PAJ76378.1 hypothetical protein CJF42_00305 [Pseudoalteromonas sp. NBT06-2]
MIDMASFERQLFLLFDATGAEGQGYTYATLDDSKIQLQPCFALGYYRFAISDYYHAIRQGEKPVLP